MGYPILGDPVPLGYRLDHDIFYKPEKKWEPVDLVVPVGRSGICKRSSCLTTIGRCREKLSHLHHASELVGQRLNKQKTKILRINADTDEPVTLEVEELEEVESYTYLGKVVGKQERTDTDVKSGIGKTQEPFIMLKKVWNCRKIGDASTKVRLFDSGVVVWSRNVANNQDIEEEDPDPELHHAISIESEKKGRPRNTRRQELEKNFKRTGHIWKQLGRIAPPGGEGTPRKIW